MLLVLRNLKQCSQHTSKATATYDRLTKRRISSVTTLSSWKLDEFRARAFTAHVPAALPQGTVLPPACTKWFTHDNDEAFDLRSQQPQTSELRTSFWKDYAQTIVPLEITRASEDDPSLTRFDRVDAPLGLLLAHLKSGHEAPMTHSVYLAQHDLRDLPTSLQADLPTPNLVKEADKGDVYSSSLWLGRPPTYTPLHRDPNPNLFLQLAGTKIIRLFHPQIGDAIFQHSQRLLRQRSSLERPQEFSDSHSPSLRNEGMMQGLERTVLHDLIWEDPISEGENQIVQHAQVLTLSLGEALFIPKGWWHSVKSVGTGVSASANWWFR